MLFDEVKYRVLPKLRDLTHSLFYHEKKADISRNRLDISGAVSHIDAMIPAVASRGSNSRPRHMAVRMSW
jgi:hypothetical protein